MSNGSEKWEPPPQQQVGKRNDGADRFESAGPPGRDMGTESQMPTSGETAFRQNSFVGQQNMSKTFVKKIFVRARDTSLVQQQDSKLSRIKKAVVFKKVDEKTYSIFRKQHSPAKTETMLNDSNLNVAQPVRGYFTSKNTGKGKEKNSPFKPNGKFGNTRLTIVSRMAHTTLPPSDNSSPHPPQNRKNLSTFSDCSRNLNSPIPFRIMQCRGASISSNYSAALVAEKMKKGVATSSTTVSNDMITRQHYSRANTSQIQYDSDFNVGHCETVVCEEVASSGTQSLEERTLTESQGRYENNPATTPFSSQANTMQLPPANSPSNPVPETFILPDSDGETEGSLVNQYGKKQSREISRSSVAPENISSSAGAYAKRVATSSTTESDNAIASAHSTPSQVAQWSPEQSLGYGVQEADEMNITDGMIANTKRNETSEHLDISAFPDDAVSVVANSVHPSSEPTPALTATLTPKQLALNSSLSQSTQKVGDLSGSDANTEAPSPNDFNTSYDEDFGSSPYIDNGTPETETQNIEKPAASSIEADQTNTSDVPESSNALEPSFSDEDAPEDDVEEDLISVYVNDLLYPSDDENGAFSPQSPNISSSRDFAPIPVPSEDSDMPLRRNSKSEEPNSQNMHVVVEDNEENEQVANQQRDVEHKALMKLRDKDPIMDNTFPMKAAKHIIKRATSDDEEEPRCIGCGKGQSRYRPLLQCQGKMNGLVEENEEDPKSEKFEERCKCVFHVDCMKKYNAGDFNLQYSARAECQGKLQCSLHCCEKCNLERHKQSAYQGDIIECDLCLRAFHSVSCLPAGCEVITKEFDGHKYRRIICDAHSSDKRTTPKKHIKVCSSSECQFTGKDHYLQKCNTCVRSFHMECKIAKNAKGTSNFAKRCDFCVLDATMRINSPVLALCPRNQEFRLGTISDWSSLPDSEHPMEKRGNMLVEWKHVDSPTASKFSVLPVQNGADLIGRYCGHLDYEFNGDAADMIAKHEERIRQNRPYFSKLVAKEGIHCRKFHTKSKEVEEKIKDLQTTCSSSCKGNCLDNSCDNFFDYLECPKNCKKGCQNKQLRNGEINWKIEIGQTEKKGFGVFTRFKLVAGEYLAPYVGELIDEKEKTRRQRAVRESRDVQGNHYMMKQGERGLTIDAAAYGNIARYFNHSCEPNAEATRKKMWVKTVGGNDYFVERVYIEAIRNIDVDEEITIAYEMENVAYLTTCHCRSPKCTKTMGKAQNERESKDSQSTLQWRENTAYYRPFVVDQPPPCLLLENVETSCFINSSLNLLYQITPFRDWILSTPNRSHWIDALKDVFDKTQNNAVRVRELMASHFHQRREHDAMEAIENVVTSIQEEQMDNGGIPPLDGSYQVEEFCSNQNCMVTTRNRVNGTLTNILARNASLQTLIDEAFPATLRHNLCLHGEISRRYKWTSDSEYCIVSLIREATQRLMRTPGSVIISLFGVQWRIAGFTRYLDRHYDAFIRDGDIFYCVNDSRLQRNRIPAKRMRLADFGVSSILLKRIIVENTETSSGAAPLPNIQTDGRREEIQQDLVDARGKRSIDNLSLDTKV